MVGTARVTGVVGSSECCLSNVFFAARLEQSSEFGGGRRHAFRFGLPERRLGRV
jgi:hypothetical protein